MKAAHIYILILYLIILAGCVPKSALEEELNKSKTATSPTITVRSDPFLSNTEVMVTDDKVKKTATITPVKQESTMPSKSMSPSTNTPTATLEFAQAAESIPECSMDDRTASDISAGLPGTLIYQDSLLQQFHLISGNNQWEIDPSPGSTEPVYLIGWAHDESWLAYSNTALFGENGDLLKDLPILGLTTLTGDRFAAESAVNMAIFEPEITKYSAHRIIGWRPATKQAFENNLILMQVGILWESSLSNHVDLVYGLFDPVRLEWMNNYLLELPGWETNSAVAFSPDFSKAMYTAAEPDEHVLWDMRQNAVLWRKPNEEFIPMVLKIYRWSANGARVGYLISIKEGMSSLTSNGREIPVRKPTFSDEYYRHDDFQLSPDGRFASMNIYYYDSGSMARVYELFVYDFNTERYTLRCPLLSGTNLYWSPDSRYLASGVYSIDAIDSEMPLFVYDVMAGSFSKLAEDGNAVGWLSTSTHIQSP